MKNIIDAITSGRLGRIEFEAEHVVGSSVESIASAAEENLTTCSVTPVLPDGATIVRAILVATLHAANQGANTHHIALTVQGQRAAGGWVDQLDLSAQPSLGLVNVDASADGWGGAIDVTTLFTVSGVQYDFRFTVDSDDANAVVYTQNFTLVVVYTI